MANHYRRRGDMALLAILAAAAVLIGVRVGYASSFFESESAAFWGNLYIIVGLVICLVGFLLATVLIRPSRHGDPSIFPVALTAGLFGLSLVIGNGFDTVMWLGFGRLPAPSDSLLNLTDTILLTGTLLCGIFAGIYLIRLALIWIAEERFCGGLFRWASLLPTLWIWLRVARYEMAHANLVEISFSVYDFLLFMFGMLFLFRFSALAAGVGRKKLSTLRFLAAATAICGLSDTLVRFGLYLTKDSQLYESIPLINGVDFFLSLFALATAYFLWNGGLYDTEEPGGDDNNGAAVSLILDDGADELPAVKEKAVVIEAEDTWEPVSVEETAEEPVEPIAPPEAIVEPVEPAVEEVVESTEEIAPSEEVTVEEVSAFEEPTDTAEEVDPIYEIAKQAETFAFDDGKPTMSADDILNDILAARQTQVSSEEK